MKKVSSTMVAIGAVPMVKSLSNSNHRALYQSFIECAEKHLSKEKLEEVTYFTKFKPLFNTLIEYSKKVSITAETKKRNLHLAKADKFFLVMRQTVSKLSKIDDENEISEAKVIKEIISSAGNATRKAINDKITSYIYLIEKLNEHPTYMERLGEVINSIYSTFINEVNLAKEMHDIIDSADVINMDKKIASVRPEIDASYRNIMSYLNAERALKEDDFTYEKFMSSWQEKVNEFRNAYASKKGSRISAKQRKSASYSCEEQNEGNASTTKKKRYTAPKPKNIRIPTVMNTSNSHSSSTDDSPWIGLDLNSIPDFDPDKHYSQYKLGDLVKFHEVVYRVKDLGQCHYPPYSKLGELGWERVN